MIRVLVVDDSAVVRKALTQALAHDPEIEVVGAAPDPYVARDLIARTRPHVLTLDIDMPRMDGLTFLAKLMGHCPLPVVIVSSLTPRGSRMALQALELGAIDVISKPESAYAVGDLGAQLARTIKAAALIDVRKLVPAAPAAPPGLQPHSRCSAPPPIASSRSAARPAGRGRSRRSSVAFPRTGRRRSSCSTCRPGSRGPLRSASTSSRR